MLGVTPHIYSIFSSPFSSIFSLKPWKFRVNGGWDINLGGSLNNLTAGGDNLTVAGNTVKLYPTRKTKDNIYCTVE